MEKKFFVKLIFFGLLGCLIVIIGVPLLFGNFVFPNLDNENWITLFGHLIGGVFGSYVVSMVTLIGLYFTLKYDKTEAKIDRDENRIRDLENERKNIMPYIHLCVSGFGGKGEQKFSFREDIDSVHACKFKVIRCKLQNVGRDSAVNLQSWAYRYDEKKIIKRNIFENKSSLSKNEMVENIQLYVPILENEQSFQLEFGVTFNDLIGNKYAQSYLISISKQKDDEIVFSSYTPTVNLA